MIKDNLKSVKKKVEEAAKRSGRSPDSVKIVVVTKEADSRQIREALDAGVTQIGENRVKDASLKKIEFDSADLSWHMIGHLQSNKVKDAVKIFSLIHSVDSLRLAYIIDKEARKFLKIQDILIEVNVSGEDAKFGIKPDELAHLLQETKTLKNINVLGLMTMAPLLDNPENARPYFKKLKELALTHRLKELSMGMTQDYEIAVEEGATMVRVGSAIFRGET